MTGRWVFDLSHAERRIIAFMANAATCSSCCTYIEQKEAEDSIVSVECNVLCAFDTIWINVRIIGLYASVSANWMGVFSVSTIYIYTCSSSKGRTNIFSYFSFFCPSSLSLCIGCCFFTITPEQPSINSFSQWSIFLVSRFSVRTSPIHQNSSLKTLGLAPDNHLVSARPFSTLDFILFSERWQ